MLAANKSDARGSSFRTNDDERSETVEEIPHGRPRSGRDAARTRPSHLRRVRGLSAESARTGVHRRDRHGKVGAGDGGGRPTAGSELPAVVFGRPSGGLRQRSEGNSSLEKETRDVRGKRNETGRPFPHDAAVSLPRAAGPDAEDAGAGEGHGLRRQLLRRPRSVRAGRRRFAAPSHGTVRRADRRRIPLLRGRLSRGREPRPAVETADALRRGGRRRDARTGFGGTGRRRDDNPGVAAFFRGNSE
mmetsp:Transcript_12356/g.27057  ORF Transcript_12356/g.27057 Transcript_12356/m.27057 type:complete len:246 (-) Transcript_12356:604-1341(-)